MGYLSQKKKHARESIFLKMSFIVFGLLTIAGFMPAPFAVVKNGLFQAYVLNLLIFFYAIYIRRPLFAFLFSVLLILNYFQMAASARIFFNAEVKGLDQLEVSYEPDKPLQVANDDVKILRRGHLVLDNKNFAPFLAVEKDNHIFTLIGVNLRKSSAAARQDALRRLSGFISEQDEAVIVMGDFGAPAWSDEMKKFLENTRLEVKNRLLFVSKGSRHNYLRAPGFYVLSFQNIGIEKLKVKSPVSGKAYPQIQIQLDFY